MSRKTQPGFTLIELMMSMAFIGVMLIAIVLCIIQMSTIYSRGETMRQINQATRTISNDVERTVAESYPFEINQASLDAGRLCVGKYSYVWNTPSTTNTYTNASDGVIRFVRVNDPQGSLCKELSSPIVYSDATELMEASDRTLTIRSFAMSEVRQDVGSGQRLYTITIVIGTNDSHAINTTANTCKNPDEDGADSTYCAVNESTITVRAGMR